MTRTAHSAAAVAYPSAWRQREASGDDPSLKRNTPQGVVPMVDVMLAELREQFLSYLKTTFGDEFPRLLDEPAGLQIGERVMYRLASGKTGTRHEPSEQEIENLR